MLFKDGVLSINTENIRSEDVVAVIKRGQVKACNLAVLSLDPLRSSSPLPVKLRTTFVSELPPSFLAEHPIAQLPRCIQPRYEDGSVLQVVISTLSGTGLASQFWDDVLHPLLEELGWDETRCYVTKTSSAESLKNFARTTLKEGAERGVKQTVVLLSGDGGVVDTINGLFDDLPDPQYYVKPVLVLIPLGTGNALFHSLHRSSTISSLYIQSLRTLLNGSPRPLPMFRVVFSSGARLLTNEARKETPLKHSSLYGAVVASYGLHATLVADSDTAEYRKFGDKRFELVARDLLFPDQGTPHAYRAQVTVDGKELHAKEYGYLLATLVSNLEKTFTISPLSEPLDRKLRLIRFNPLEGNEAMEIMKAAYDNGKHVALDAVDYEVVQKVKIAFQEPGASWKWRRCCVDGLIIGVEEGGWMEFEIVKSEQEAVMVVVP